MKRITLILSLLLLLSTFSSAHAIKKCQDADGKWHYGDIAVSQCNRSKVTTLNDRGFIASEKEAPKTDEELQTERDAKVVADAEAAVLLAEEKEQNRILSVYETEADIDRQRDNQLGSVESNMAVHKAYLKAVNSRIARLESQGAGLTGKRQELNLKEISDAQALVDESTIEFDKLVKQKVTISERFDREKETYLKLKNSK